MVRCRPSRSRREQLPVPLLLLCIAAGAHAVARPAHSLVRLPAISNVGAQYQRLMEQHYLSLSALQAGVLRGAADVASQTARLQGSGVPVDLHHSGSIAFIGVVVSGFGGAMWLRHLEASMGPSTGPRDVARKAALDYTCWAPFANSAYLMGVPLLSGSGWDFAFDRAQSGFLSVMGLELSIFAPYNLFAFSKVPPPLRPPIQTFLSVIFTLVLSALC